MRSHARRAIQDAHAGIPKPTPSPSELFYVGLTHQTAPLAVRERFHLDAHARREFLACLADLADARLILATCERFEVYATTRIADPAIWLARLAGRFGVPRATVGAFAKTLRGPAVAEHLLRVAAGLESRILGEPQILGQVRSACLESVDAGASDPVLSALGRAAVHAGKRTRHETAVNRGRRSIAARAVDRIVSNGGSLRDRSVVVVGTGRLGTEVAAHLAAGGAGRMVIVGRHAERAEVLARRFGASHHGLDRLADCLVRADVAIMCAATSTFVVDAHILSALPPRRLLLIDLGVPRNVDPAVAGLAGVRLFHLEDLIAGDTSRLGDASAASRIVQEELATFLRWQRERRVVPQIARLTREARAQTTADRRTLHERIVLLKREAAA